MEQSESDPHHHHESTTDKDVVDSDGGEVSKETEIAEGEQKPSANSGDLQDSADKPLDTLTSPKKDDIPNGN